MLVATAIISVSAVAVIADKLAADLAFCVVTVPLYELVRAHLHPRLERASTFRHVGVGVEAFTYHRPPFPRQLTALS